MRRQTAASCFETLAAMLAAAVLALAIHGRCAADMMNVTLEASSYDIVAQPDSTIRIVMAGYSYLTAPGEPAVPFREFTILLPPDAEAKSIEIRGENETELFARYRIAPAPLPDSLAASPYGSSARRLWQTNYDHIYGKDEWFPEVAGRPAGHGSIEKFRFARVTFYPFSIAPQSGRLLFRPTANVDVEYDRGTRDSSSLGTAEERRQRAEWGQKTFVNYRYMHLLYFPVPPGDVDYDLAVTSADIVFFVQQLFGGEETGILDLSGDLNCDGTVSFADIVALVAYVLKAGPSPRDHCTAP